MLQKIVYFLDFPYGTGGSSKVLLTQACIMHGLGYKTVVVIPNNEKGMHISIYDEICNANSLKIITTAYPVSTSVEQIDMIETLSCCNNIIQLLISEKPDLIHSVQINVAVELAARELGIPHLMNIYPTDLETFNIKWMDVLPKYHSADSRLFVERWGKGLGIPSRCIRVAYQYEKKGKGKAARNKVMPLHLLSIGILAEHKNQMELLRFLSICKEKEIRVTLTILGDYNTSYGEKCLEYVKQNNLEEEVVFHGYVQNVEDYFVQADLMILSSRVESFPGVIVESMANRVPVLSTPVTGIMELLRDGYNSFLAKGYYAEDIFEAFKSYLVCRETGGLQKVIDHAYETYLQNHSYDSVGTQLELYYNWILEDYSKKNSLMRINEVKSKFESFIQERNFNEMTLQTSKSLWYLYHIYEMNKRKNFQKIVIWGAGTFGRIAVEWLEILGCKENLIGYIDTYKKGNYLDYPIFEDKEQIIKSCDVVFLAVGDVNSCLGIMKYIEQFGKRRNRDYFMIQNAPIRI